MRTCFLRRWAVLVDLLGIETPGNAVELDISPGDLTEEVDGQQVEALDFVCTAADAWEVPVPHDLVARVQDVEGLDAHFRVLGHFSHPLCLRGGGWGIPKLLIDR